MVRVRIVLKLAVAQLRRNVNAEVNRDRADIPDHIAAGTSCVGRGIRARATTARSRANASWPTRGSDHGGVSRRGWPIESA
jgi:hypothetical protein